MLRKGHVILVFGERKELAENVTEEGDGMVRLTFTDGESIRRSRTTKFDTTE
jgi:hypothetical protein